MDKKMTVSQLEDTFIEDLNNLEDWFLQYEYLLAISSDMPMMKESEKTPEHKVPGCQSGVWIILDCSDRKIYIRADSEALIIRGIISIYVQLLDGRTPKEVITFQPRFIEQTNIGKQVSTDRFHGLQTVLSMIQEFAAQYVNVE